MSWTDRSQPGAPAPGPVRCDSYSSPGLCSAKARNGKVGKLLSRAREDWLFEFQSAELGVLLSSYLPRSSFPVPVSFCSGFAPVDAAGFWESGFVVLLSCVFFSEILSVEKKQHINRSIYATLNTAVLDSRWCVCVFFLRMVFSRTPPLRFLWTK